MKKITKKIKAYINFFKKVKKAFMTLKKDLKKATLIEICVIMCACGTTKVSVSKPAEGTSTTITVTTNNPVSTQVNPSINPTINQ